MPTAPGGARWVGVALWKGAPTVPWGTGWEAEKGTLAHEKSPRSHRPNRKKEEERPHPQRNVNTAKRYQAPGRKMHERETPTLREGRKKSKL